MGVCATLSSPLESAVEEVNPGSELSIATATRRASPRFTLDMTSTASEVRVDLQSSPAWSRKINLEMLKNIVLLHQNSLFYDFSLIFLGHDCSSSKKYPPYKLREFLKEVWALVELFSTYDASLSLRYPLKTINHNTSTVLRMGQLLQNILALSI